VACCTVCKHRDRVAIEAAIAQGDDELAITARFRGVSRAALQKHRDHLVAADTKEPEPCREVPCEQETESGRSQRQRGARKRETESDLGARVVQLRPDAISPDEAAPPALPGRGVSDEDLANAYHRCVRLLDALERLITKLEREDSSARDLLGAYKELRESITLLARLTRELGPERELVILGSAKWRAIEGALIEALRPYPDAAAAAGAALQALEAA
jgi:ribosomal 50S subunit-associated protein YjgA (DUF615 family)